jgi:vancomycin resistance protein YoaR
MDGRNGLGMTTMALAFASALVAPPARADSTAPRSDRARPAPAEVSFPVALGSYSTTLIGSLPARTVNIRLAAQALDGAVLDPGQVLSFNRLVGARTLERGYQNAPVFLRGQRDQQLGGGICQVASTVFVAALLSGLSSAERHKHTFIVDYIPLAWDATIAWRVKDLKLRNDLDQPVRLRVEVLGSTLSARFEGEEDPGETFELDAVEHETPAGPGEPSGREVELYRLRRVGGEEIAREFMHRDVYPPSQGARAGGP